MMMGRDIFDFEALRAGETYQKPYRFLAAQGVVSADNAALIRRDYPDIRKSGYLPLSKFTPHGAFAALIGALQSPALAEILSQKLALDLAEKPRMITIRRISKNGDGRIHNDSISKICTMLVYLNETWDVAAGGAIRALNGPDDMDDFAFEAPPVAGNVFAFARSDDSWHGHPPFAGERFVVQTTFLQSEEALARKESRGGVQLWMKRLNLFSR